MILEGVESFEVSGLGVRLSENGVGPLWLENLVLSNRLFIRSYLDDDVGMSSLILSEDLGISSLILLVSLEMSSLLLLDDLPLSLL